MAIIVCMSLSIAHASTTVFHNLPLGQSGPIYSIDQDSDGMLWLGTAKGLCCFDGYRLVQHREAHDANIIYSVCNIDDYVVMGGIDGLTVYNRKTGKTIGLNHPVKEEVRTLLRQNDHVIVGSSKALYRLQPKTGEITTLSNQPRSILSMAQSDRGLLVGTMSGLYEYTAGKYRRLPVFTRQELCCVDAIEYDSQTGRYWIGTFEHLYSFDLHTNQIALVPQLPDVVVKSIESTPAGLFVSSDDGLYILHDGELQHMVHDSQNPASLGNNIVWDVFCDAQSNIILGSDLCLSFIDGCRWSSYHSLYSLTGSTMGNDLTCLAYDSDGTLWMGGTVGVIHMSQPVCWFRQYDKEYMLSHNRVRDIHEDRDHNMWISTDIGLNIYDRQHAKMLFRMPVDAATGSEVPWTYALADDRHGRLWMASCNNGVYVISRQKMLQDSYHCVTDRQITKGLSSQHVSHITIGSGDKVWIGTSAGIDIIDATTYNVTNIRHEHADCMCTDSHGNVWIADSKGIDIYASPDKLLRHIAFNTTLNTGEIVALVEVGDDMWVVTPTCCAVSRNGQWLTTMRLPFVTANCACYDKAKKQIVIGGVDGTFVFNPQQVLSHNDKQKLLLTDLLVNGQQYIPEDAAISVVRQIRLSHSENNLEFCLSDMPLSNTGQAIYAYRLKGLDKEWHYLQRADDRIIYNSIPYGDYTLEVHATDGFDEVGRQLYSLDIDILPPWYLSWLAKLVYLLLTIAAVYVAINFYMTRQSLRKEQMARQQIMQESAARVTFYSTLSRKLHHGICHIMTTMANLYDQDSNDQQIKAYRKLSYEATRLNAFVRQALDTGVSDEEMQGGVEHRMDIAKYCQGLFHSMSADGELRCMKLKNKSQTGSLRHNVNIIQWDTVAYTLIKSVMDYSDNGATIEMDVHRNDDNSLVCVSISSDRFAVDEQKRTFFFHRYYGLMANDDFERTQNMYLIKEYADRHQGSATITTAEGIVTVTLKLPLDRSAEAEHATDNDADTPAISMRDDKLLKEITSLIESNMSNSDFNVTELQKQLGIGSKLLYRKVKLTTGMSPVEYIRDIRMKHAAQLLSQGRFAISEVMYMVGFSNSGYFSKCFQKTFNMTPTTYMHQKQ